MELIDVLAIAEMLVDEGVLSYPDRSSLNELKRLKKEKVVVFLIISEGCGRLQNG